MAKCNFCELIAGRGPVSVVYEDEDVFAFMDIQPVIPGHVLIIPRRHASSLAELGAADAARLMPVGQKVAAALRTSGLRCEGVNFFLADGEAAGQEVAHVHLHVFPRWSGDGFGLRLPPNYRNLPPRSELDEIAANLRKHISP
jgi:diadenosine tetraphosphate (Ap4A) HIT family hydrolase